MRWIAWNCLRPNPKHSVTIRHDSVEGVHPVTHLERGRYIVGSPTDADCILLRQKKTIPSTCWSVILATSWQGILLAGLTERRRWNGKENSQESGKLNSFSKAPSQRWTLQRKQLLGVKAVSLFQLTLDFKGDSGDNCLRSLEAVKIITSEKDNLSWIWCSSNLLWYIDAVETHRKYSSSYICSLQCEYF